MNTDYRLSAIRTRSSSDDDTDEIDLTELLSLLWSGKHILAVAIAAACLAGVLYLIGAAPVFEADGLVQIEQDGGNAGIAPAMGAFGSMLGAPMETEAEIQILQSRMVLTKVIEQLKLQIDVQPHYFPFFGAFVARQRTDGDELEAPLFGLDSFAWGGERAVVTQFDVPADMKGASFTLRALGNDEFQLIGPDGEKVLLGKVGAAVQGRLNGELITLFVQELRANPGARFDLIHWRLQDVLKRLLNNIEISEQGKQSGMIGLDVEGPSPHYVSSIVQHIEDVYVRQNVEQHSAEAQQSLDFLKKQLPEVKGRVDAAQAKLNAYQMKKGSVNVTKETELVLQQSVDLETKRLELIGQREEALNRFTPEHPAVQALDAQIKSIEKEQANIKRRTEGLPSTQQEVLSLMRDLNVNTQLYTALLNSTQELQVTKAGTVGSARIIDYPLPPDQPAKPKPALVMAICAFLGAFLGCGYLLVRMAVSTGVSQPSEVEEALGLVTYAAIPYTDVQRRMGIGRRRTKGTGGILAALEPENVAIEALRSLRTSLQFALLEAQNNVLMFTGPTPGLGKSFVSINLGAILAMSGKRVVVIDGDLRRGYLHQYIGQEAVPGLSDYIASDASWDSLARSTTVDGLTIITNGTTPPNPSELLLHERFSELIERASNQFDIVIIDSPPVLPVTDASVIGRLAGSTLLVLKEGEHPMRVVEESTRRLVQAGVKIRGVVFNQVGARSGKAGYYGAAGDAYHSQYRSVAR
ncbi:polysaccharide biosynthesis tyrosine autokinase [Solimonas marina]|uniref:Polysaccharide biosynthesis tyrosine autokinase n=1 Tax=Solimonas marina TaxID=2714601 RepID=A0A969WAF8_9GAMM|nr:polysaccharide biosynthesis tyrosine autokinase [Solimonas marina]NKF21886.1 polysaccharide biosynthesis tyrosine autokinase [Solimonas marina]